MSHGDEKVIHFGESYLFRAEKEVKHGFPARLDEIDVDLKRFQKQLEQAQARVEKAKQKYRDTEAEMEQLRDSLPSIYESVEFLKNKGEDYDEAEAKHHRYNIARASGAASLKPLIRF